MPTYWPKADLNEARQERASSDIEELLLGFEERTRQIAESARQAAQQTVETTQAALPKPEPFTFDAAAFTPWEAAKQGVSQAAETVKQAASGFFDADALMPWQPKPQPMPDATLIDGRTAQPPALQPGESVGDVQITQGAPRPPDGGALTASGLSHPEKQAIVYQQARASGLDDEGARILVAVTETEGGMTGLIGDEGKSRGPFQFYEGGQMPGFRAWVRSQGISGDPDSLVHDVRLATRYAAEGYLGRAIAAGRAAGLSGADLATYVQQHGQVSENPWKTGQNYRRLYGGAAPTAGPPSPAAPPAPPAAAPAPPQPAPAAGVPPPISPSSAQAPGPGPKLRVRDPWGNEFEMTQQQLNNMPGGSKGYTVVGPVAQAQPMSDLDTARAETGGTQDVMLRGPLSNQPELPEDYDPRDADQGPRESGPPPVSPLAPEPEPVTPPPPSVEIADGRTVPPTPGGDWQPVETRPIQPAPAEQEPQVAEQSMPSGMLPVWDAAGQVVGYVRQAAEGIKQAVPRLAEAAKDPRNAIDTITSAGQKAVEAAAAATDPADPRNAVFSSLPIQRGVQTVQGALDAFTGEIGERTGAAAGLDETGQQIAGLVGSVVLDPTNYIGGPGAARAATRGARAAAPHVASAGRSLAEEGARQLMDLTPSPRMIQEAPGPVPRPSAPEPENAPPFFSQLRRTIEEKMPNRAVRQQVQGILKGSAVKPDEIAWTGLDDFLAEQKGPVTKQQVLDFLDQNEVRVEEVVKGGPVNKQGALQALDRRNNVWPENRPNGDPLDRDMVLAAPDDARFIVGGNGTKYGQYTLPGGENYRELLMTLPERKSPVSGDINEFFERMKAKYGEGFVGRLTPAEEAERQALSAGLREAPGTAPYRSAHWDEPNILAHVRFNDRVAPDGKRVLLIEEVQSDWASSNRKALGEVGKPQSIGELAEDVLGPEMAAVMPLQEMDGGVLAALKYDQVRRSIIARLPVDVVNNLRSAHLTPEELLRNPRVLVSYLSPDHLRSVSDGILTGARSVGAELRAKLLVASAARRDAELLPALKASDLDSRVVMGLLAPERLYHVDLPGASGGRNVAGAGAPRLVGTGEGTRGLPEGRATVGTGVEGGRPSAGRGAETAPGATRPNTKEAPASLARILDWHAQIVPGSGASSQGRYMPGPFVGSTENYVSLALKRMIRWAAENDYDRIAWPPGVVHAERYNLAQHVDELFYTTKDGSVGTLVGRKGGRDIVSHDGVPADKLGDYVGQDAARKLLDREPETVRGADQYYLTGRDLAQMGGEGMKGFYDQILPATAQKLGKKFGARVGQSEITTSPADLAQARARAEAAGNTAFLERNPTQSQSVHSLDITPEMKQSVLKEGQPLFAGVPFDPASAAVGAGAGAASGEEGEADPGRTAAGMVVAGLLGRRFPGVAAAQAAAQKRAAALAARGQAPLSPLQWTRKLVGTAGYSSMIGPATATVNVFGNLLEPLWAIPKEAARSITPRRLGGRGNPREFGEMALGAFHGMGQTGQAIVDALAARGRYASNPDHPHLSEQTVNPIGHAIAASLEAGGRVFSGLPDAVFGTIARSAGEARRAAQIATDEGLTGAPWKQRVQGLLQDVEQHRGAQGATPSPQVDDIIKSGEQYADRQTFRDELGTVGKGAAAMAGRNVPVVGNLLTPFFNTPWNMGVALAERTPVGAVMNRQKGFDKAYDAVVGTALVAGLAFGPVAAGKITGSGPDDPEKRKMLQAEGWRPYHTLVGDTYIPNRVFGIYGKLLNAAGEVHDALAFQKKDATAREMSGDAFRRFGKLLKEEPYLQGLADIMAAITDPQAGGVEGYVAQNVTRLLPYAATTRTIGTAQDTNERETDRGRDVSMTESVSQRVQQGVGARSELPVAQDVMGRPRENQTPGIWSVLPKFSQKRAEPLVRAYLDAGVDIGTPPDKIDNVPLKPAQQRRYREVMGRELERIAGPTIRGAGWANMPPQVKKQLLETFQSAARVLAETAVSSEGGSKFAEDRAKATVDKALGR